MRGEAVRWVGRGLGFAIGPGIAAGLWCWRWPRRRSWPRAQPTA